MIVDVAQRWRDRRSTYRPAGEPIVTSRYEVAAIPDDTTARRFVEQHHYERSLGAARFRAGLFRAGELVGVAVLTHPSSEAALEKALPLPCERLAKTELGRLVLLNDVPSNGESWFVARVFELARLEGFEAIVSHADPEPRTDIAGGEVFLGHYGGIYQALNAVYRGKTNPSTIRLLPDGHVLNNRTIGKLRKRERGFEPVVEQLVAFGAPPPSGDWRTWVRAAVAATTRPVRHRGKHRYVWALDRRLRRHLPDSMRYPKLEVRA